MNQTDWRQLLRSGVRALRQQQVHQGLAQIRQAHQLAPNEKDTRFWLANALRMTGETAQAEKIFLALIKAYPKDESVSFALAFLQRAQGRYGDAAETLLGLANRLSTDLGVLLKIMGFMLECDQFKQAIVVCKQAIQLSPKQADLYIKMSRMYQCIGDFEEALRLCRQALDLEPRLSGAWLTLAHNQKFTDPSHKDFQRMQSHADRDLGEEANLCLQFALGKANDDLKQWQQAFEHYRRGNQMRRGQEPWDKQAWKAFVDQSQNQQLETTPHNPDIKGQPIFIVGMLRSGTTLLEHRLHQHPEIAGRGELNHLAHSARQNTQLESLSIQQRQQLAANLWRYMRQDGPEHHSYIDKNPLNYRFLGHALALLPNAKVIHITRDGRNSCLSCFFQLFRHPDVAFTNDLDDMTDMYADYRKLMAHWSQHYADRILQIDYADLVLDMEQQLKRTLEFIGRPWDGAVLGSEKDDRVVRTASLWQVRQSLYTRSLERWKNYYDFAPEFFDRIQAIDQQYQASE